VRLKARVADLEEQLNTLRGRVSQNEMFDARNMAQSQSNEDQIKEVRTRMWPLFALGEQGNNELLRTVRDLQDAVSNFPNNLVEINGVVDALRAAVVELKDEISVINRVLKSKPTGQKK